MKRATIGMMLPAWAIALLGSAALLADPASSVPTKAKGEGSIAFKIHGEHGNWADDDDEDGRGYLLFQVERKPGGVSGTLVFGAEVHHAMLYPEIVVRVKQIEEVEFTKRLAKFTAKGKLQNDPVKVSVSAYDGDMSDEPDRFTIKCVNGKGEVVFAASGELFIGDISVGVPQ